MSLFVTGTDTGAGKTFATSLLIRGLRKEGIDCVGMKPICCGGREDAEALWHAADEVVSLNEVNSVWLRTPAAPFTASLVENRSVDVDLIRQDFATLTAAHACVLVEGVGGWLVPITANYGMSDLAAEMAFPVAVVVANRLGAINHACLTVRAIQERGLTCAAIILNDVNALTEETIATTTNGEVLRAVLGLPLLQISHGQTALELGPALKALIV